MIDTEVFSAITLANGLEVRFSDQSNRYFGDFHRVRIEVRAQVSADQLELDDELRSLVSRLSGPLRYQRTLERMGVPGAELPKVKKQLVEEFLQSARSYLEHPDFPRQLLKKNLGDNFPTATPSRG